LLKTVELDPLFAEAHELLAYTYWYGETMDAAEAQAGTYNAAKRALAIDPSLVFAQALLFGSESGNYSLSKELEALDRAARDNPSRWAATETLTWTLLTAGYIQEALGVIERRVDSDPLSAAVQNRLSEALAAAGRRDEALASLKLADHLGGEVAKQGLFHFYLVDKRDAIAITIFETYLKEDEKGLPRGWVGDLVGGARDPVTGQAHLDRRIPEIVASMPEDRSYEMRQILTRMYLSFGFLDRYFELLDELGAGTSFWNDADILVFYGTINRASGFTAHPRYLEAAEKHAYGVVSLWEQRGPPDHCEKLDGQWICK
jgi:tetratricopeptide (TPR) repeat protein